MEPCMIAISSSGSPTELNVNRRTTSTTSTLSTLTTTLSVANDFLKSYSEVTSPATYISPSS